MPKRIVIPTGSQSFKSDPVSAGSSVIDGGRFAGALAASLKGTGQRLERNGKARSPAGGVSSIDVASLCDALLPLIEGRGAGRRQASRLPEEAVERFLAMLIDEDTDACDRYFFDHADRVADPQVVAADLLGPAACLLGDYWRMDVCDFMKVTVVMARLQRLFWQLVSVYPPRPLRAVEKVALLTPAPNEQHNFGVCIVEDALRRAGWQVDLCGLGEEDAFFDLLSRNNYTIVGISLSGSALAHTLPAFVRQTRKLSRNVSTSVIVGGSLFVEKPDLVAEARPDWLARDVSDAVILAESVVSPQMADA